MSDILERLRNYTPPDRVFEELRQMATDIYEAAEEITRLRQELAEVEQLLNDNGVPVTSSDDIPEYDGLELSVSGRVELICQELAECRALYNELIYEVASKFPGESRHKTARRYIRQMENRPCEGPCETETTHE